jgi:hypothetical protein
VKGTELMKDNNTVAIPWGNSSFFKTQADAAAALAQILQQVPPRAVGLPGLCLGLRVLHRVFALGFHWVLGLTIGLCPRPWPGSSSRCLPALWVHGFVS